MNTTELLDLTRSMFDMPKTMVMNTERKRRWQKAVQVILDEALLSQAEQFKKDVMVLAKKLIGEYATTEDAIKLLSDKTTDNQKMYNVYLNTKTKGKDAESVAAMKVVKSRKWRNTAAPVHNTAIPTAIPVCQYTLDGKFVKEYPSISAAAKAVGAAAGSISAAVRKRTRSSGGFIWKRKDDNTPVIPCTITVSSYPKQVGQFGANGKLLKKFKSIAEASNTMSINYEALRKAIDSGKALHGYKWCTLESC